MKLSDKTYDILAFIGRVLLPSLALAYGNLADVWGLPLKSEIVQTIGIIATLILNVFLQEISKNYHAEINKMINTASNAEYSEDILNG